MGLFDMVEQLAAGSSSADHARVAGGLVQVIQERPGGFGGLIQTFQQNGLGDKVQQWSQGQTQPANPADMEAGLRGTGIIDSIAQRTGLSPTILRTGLAVVVPVLIHHLIANHHVTASGEPAGSPPQLGGLLQSILGHIL